MADFGLNDIIEGIQYAVMEAQEVAEEHHLELVSRFFDEQESGKWSARTQTVLVDGKSVEIPLICLAQLGGIRIKELRVRFQASLSSLDPEEDGDQDQPKEEKEIPRRQGRQRRRALRKLKMDLRRKASGGCEAGEGEGGTQVDIEVTFQGTDPPEGVVRVNNLLLQKL